MSLRPSAWRAHADACREPKDDGRKGASSRASYTNAFKWKVLRTLHEMQAIAKQTERSFSHRVTINPVSDTADTHGIDKSLVSKWNRDRDTIIEAARKRCTAHKTKKSTKRYKFADVDKLVLDELGELRLKKLRVGPRWLIRTYRRHLKEKFPSFASHWRGSAAWRAAFYQRNRIALRKRTCLKKYTCAEALEKLAPFCAGIQKRVMETYKPDRGWSDFYGQYPRELRSNVDQVCAAIT